MADLETLATDGLTFTDQASAPTTPATGTTRMFTESDGAYVIDDGGSVSGPLLDETAHDALDHTGLTGVGSGSGLAFAANLPRDVGTLDLAAVNNSALSNQSANRAHFIPFVPKKGFTTAKVYFRCTNATGNIDVGIYDASLTRLVSTGSVSIPGTGNQSIALVQALTAGSLYYLAYAMSSTTSTFYGWDSGINALVTGLAATSTQGAFAYLDGGLPLPAGPVTPTGYDPYTKIIGFWVAP